jgi:hypothetical protein
VSYRRDHDAPNQPSNPNQPQNTGAQELFVSHGRAYPGRDGTVIRKRLVVRPALRKILEILGLVEIPVDWGPPFFPLNPDIPRKVSEIEQVLEP